MKSVAIRKASRDMLADDRSVLERAVKNAEPDLNVRLSVLGIYDALAYIKEKYFFSQKREPDGMIVFTNFEHGWHSRQAEPELRIDDWKSDLSRIQASASVHQFAGHKVIEELLYHNGAVEVDGQSGHVVDYQRRIVVKTKIEGIDVKHLGFDEEVRRTLAHKDYKGIGTRHLTALYATKADDRIWIALLSRQSGVINMLHMGRIAYSTIPSERSDFFADENNPYFHKPVQLEFPFLLDYKRFQRL